MGKVKVLYVEDNTLQAVSVVEPLSEKYDFRWCKTGMEALREYNRDLPDIILLDLNLPDIHGKEIVAKIRESDYITPILILTMERGINLLKKILQMKANYYISKPLDVEEVELWIEKTLNDKPMYNEFGLFDNIIDKIKIFFEMNKGNYGEIRILARRLKLSIPEIKSFFHNMEGEKLEDFCNEIRFKNIQTLFKKNINDPEDMYLRLGFKTLDEFYGFISKHSGKTFEQLKRKSKP